MPELLTVDTPAAEVGSLAQELARAYHARLEFYEREYKMTHSEALAHVALGDDEFRRRALTDPPDQVSFMALDRLLAVDPAAAQEAWARVRQSARDELSSGYRAAKAMEFTGGAWQRAQFLAIRAMLIEQWQPANGGEQLLVDMLAQSYASYLSWMQHLTVYTEAEAVRHDKNHPDARYEPPRMSSGEAMEQAAAMVDRFNRLYLRTLRSQRDLRRYAPAVTIQHAGQVNIGQQQVNAAQIQGER